jgi:cytochrome oxidase Cu insertion factor (SCO1/SenC/PrrC family)
MRILLIIALLAALVGCQKKPATSSTASTASTPPAAARAWSGDALDFQFTSFAGKTQKLSSLAGKPVVLNFWADW